MPVHFIHLSKTGGSAIKQAIRDAGEPETKFGKIFLHPHPRTLDELPEDHHVFFTVRDPIARFVSSFYSRLRKGRPKYFRDWTTGEEEAFGIFKTPQALGAGLASSDHKTRAAARTAMTEIRQLRRDLAKWLYSPALLKRRSDHIVYVARQETLAEDWELLKPILGYSSDIALPSDPKASHRGAESEDRSLDETATRALVKWYAGDYRLLAYCDKLRQERHWGSPMGELPSGATLLAAQAEGVLRRLKGRVSRARVSA
jgi:hypothetical protein